VSWFQSGDDRKGEYFKQSLRDVQGVIQPPLGIFRTILQVLADLSVVALFDLAREYSYIELAYLSRPSQGAVV